jgi:hypothetical protein
VSDLPPSIDWRRSSRCETSACVEVGRTDGLVALRDSDRHDVTLRFSLPDWAAFVAGVRAGDFEGN